MIFDDQNNVLLCHRCDRDIWNLPGGGLEKGEFVLDGLKREIKEETGLDVEVSRLVGVYDKPQESDITFSFICKVIGGQITLNAEADKIEFFSLDNLPKNIVDRHIERIMDANKHAGFSLVKRQKI